MAKYYDWDSGVPAYSAEEWEALSNPEIPVRKTSNGYQVEPEAPRKDMSNNDFFEAPREMWQPSVRDTFSDAVEDRNNRQIEVWGTGRGAGTRRDPRELEEVTVSAQAIPKERTSAPRKTATTRRPATTRVRRPASFYTRPNEERVPKRLIRKEDSFVPIQPKYPQPSRPVQQPRPKQNTRGIRLSDYRAYERAVYDNKNLTRYGQPFYNQEKLSPEVKNRIIRNNNIIKSYENKYSYKARETAREKIRQTRYQQYRDKNGSTSFNPYSKHNYKVEKYSSSRANPRTIEAYSKVNHYKNDPRLFPIYPGTRP